MAELRRFWAMAVCISIVCSNIFTLTSKAAVSALTEEKVVELALTAETLRKKAVKAIKQGKYVDVTDFEFEGDLDRVEAYEALFHSEDELYLHLSQCAEIPQSYRMVNYGERSRQHPVAGLSCGWQEME